MERDDDVQPWLRGLDDAALAQLAVELTTAICRPSFGSLSKRELEQTLFKLLYEHRAQDWRTLGEIADDLAVSRSKARSLMLEYRNRQTGQLGRGERARLLRHEVLSWPQRNVDQSGDKLRIVIDDPFMRDLLKNFAYARGILLDQSFTGEILVFGWDAYGQLLAGVYEHQGDVSTEDLQAITASLLRQIAEAAAAKKLSQAILDTRLAQLDKDVEKLLKTRGERRAAQVTEFAKTWGPSAIGLLGL